MHTLPNWLQAAVCFFIAFVALGMGMMMHAFLSDMHQLHKDWKRKRARKQRKQRNNYARKYK